VGGAVNEGSMKRFPERRPRIQARPKTQTGTQHREAATDVEQREGADFLGMSQRIFQSDRGTDDTKPCDRGWVDLIKQVDGNDSADVLRCRTQHK
jgi:hypothetical protein